MKIRVVDFDLFARVTVITFDVECRVHVFPFVVSYAPIILIYRQLQPLNLRISRVFYGTVFARGIVISPYVVRVYVEPGAPAPP